MRDWLYYCNECQHKADLPATELDDYFTGSHGPCDVCGVTKWCDNRIPADAKPDGVTAQ